MPLESLYQDKILELARLARSVSPLNDFSSSFTVRNPICGDMVTINLLIDNSGIVERYGHTVMGCALCEASAGLVVNYFSHKKLPIENFMEHFDNWLINKKIDFPKQLPEELKIFSPIQDVKSRHICIKMPFEAFFISINKK